MESDFFIINHDYKYNVKDLVGHGNYAQVYKGLSKKHGTVAIKKFYKAICNKYHLNAQFRTIVNRELEVNYLNHQNIIKFYEFLVVTEQIYLIFQYCSDGTLQDYSKKYSFQEAQIIDIFCEIVFAMAYINRLNYIHRDLKPANILMCNKKIKIGDFGLCKFMSNDIFHTPQQGTPYYMAPNILNRQKDYTNKCDVWSFGVIIYEILTKKKLFQVKNRVELQNKHLEIAQKPFLLLGNYHQFFKILEKIIVYKQSQRVSFEQLEKYVISYKLQKIEFEVNRASIYQIPYYIFSKFQVGIQKVIKLIIIFLTYTIQVLELQKSMTQLKSLKVLHTINKSDQISIAKFDKLEDIIKKFLKLSKQIKKKVSTQLVSTPQLQNHISYNNYVIRSCEQHTEPTQGLSFFQKQLEQVCNQIQSNLNNMKGKERMQQLIILKKLKTVLKFENMDKQKNKNRMLQNKSETEKKFIEKYYSRFTD